MTRTKWFLLFVILLVSVALPLFLGIRGTITHQVAIVWICICSLAMTMFNIINAPHC